MPTRLEQLTGRYLDQLRKVDKSLQLDAMTAYTEMAEKLRRISITGQDILTDSGRLVNRVQPLQIGRMCMFYYFPKHYQTLPYFDRFPMIMPVEIYDDGFLGINFHYLPPKQRALLLDFIDHEIIKNVHLDEKKRIQMSYYHLKRKIRNKLFIPCVKRYLYSHLKSRLYVVDPKSWNVALFLPLERFDKAPRQRVWVDSMRKVRKARL